MNTLLLPFYILLTIYGFFKKREYVLAIILVGQPLIKLMLNPFPSNFNENIFLIAYFGVGFVCLAIVKMMNKKSIILNISTKKYLALYLFFCITILISLIYTPDASYGASKFISFFSVSFLIIIMSIITIDNKDNFYKTMEAVANISLIIGTITVILVYLETGSLLVRLSTSQARDIEIFGVNFAVSIWFGRRMGVAFLAMLFTTLIKQNRINILKTVILLIFLILSSSRGPILSMVGTLSTITLLNINKTYVYRKFYRRIFIFMIVVLNIMVMIMILNADSILTRLLSFEDNNVLSRLDMYFFSIQSIKTNLLGYGIGSFQYFAYGIHQYPHNIILEVLFELGIHGFVVIILGVFMSMKYYFSFLKGYREVYYNAYLNFSFGVLLFALFNSQFSGDIASNEYIWFGFILMSMCKRIINKGKYKCAE